MNEAIHDILLLGIRLWLAYTFIPAGWHKLLAGQEKWLWLGTQMQHFGIYFLPVMWGVAASCAEFFGGISLLLGLGTRIGAFFIACVMIVAVVMHIANRDPFWQVWFKPLMLLVCACYLIIMGAGAWSLDQYSVQSTRTNREQQ